jgi:hypothetical protein
MHTKPSRRRAFKRLFTEALALLFLVCLGLLQVPSATTRVETGRQIHPAPHA